MISIFEDYYKINAVNYFAVCIFDTIIGTTFGLLVDKTCTYLQTKYEIDIKIMIAIQLLFIILVAYFIQMFVSDRFANDWQSTTPGLFFVSFFFGTQLNIYNNIQSLKMFPNI